MQRSMTSITLLQAPFHNLNEEADYQHHQNINDCHNKIRHHKFIAVAAYIVECNVKVGSADEAYYRCLFYKRDKFVAERRQNIFYRLRNDNFHHRGSVAHTYGSAALHLAGSTDCMPLRIISETYAALLSPNTHTDTATDVILMF